MIRTNKQTFFKFKAIENQKEQEIKAFWDKKRKKKLCILCTFNLFFLFIFFISWIGSIKYLSIFLLNTSSFSNLFFFLNPSIYKIFILNNPWKLFFNAKSNDEIFFLIFVAISIVSFVVSFLLSTILFLVGSYFEKKKFKDLGLLGMFPIFGFLLNLLYFPYLYIYRKKIKGTEFIFSKNNLSKNNYHINKKDFFKKSRFNFFSLSSLKQAMDKKDED